MDIEAKMTHLRMMLDAGTKRSLIVDQVREWMIQLEEESIDAGHEQERDVTGKPGFYGGQS